MARLGREEEALAVADEAINDNPSNRTVLTRRVTLLWRMGRPDEAMETCERAVELFPNDPWSYIYRAFTTLYRSDACASALSDASRARELDPDDTSISSQIALIHSDYIYRRCPEHFDGELALELAREYVEDAPDKAVRRTTLGLVLYRLGRYRQSREALARGLAQEKPEPGAHTLFGLAMAEWKLGNRAQARKHYAAAVTRMNETWPRLPEYVMAKREAAELLGAGE